MIMQLKKFNKRKTANSCTPVKEHKKDLRLKFSNYQSQSFFTKRFNREF